jgi:Acyclic terpene utilisation family protein AtuA
MLRRHRARRPERSSWRRASAAHSSSPPSVAGARTALTPRFRSPLSTETAASSLAKRKVAVWSIADICDASLTELGNDRVRIEGVTGHARPERLKVTICFDGGWIGEGEISYYGPNALARARLAGEIIKRRSPADIRFRCDVIGVLSVLGDDSGCGWEQLEGNAAGNSTHVRLRVAFASSDKHAVERGRGASVKDGSATRPVTTTCAPSAKALTIGAAPR